MYYVYVDDHQSILVANDECSTTMSHDEMAGDMGWNRSLVVGSATLAECCIVYEDDFICVAGHNALRLDTTAPECVDS